MTSMPLTRPVTPENRCLHQWIYRQSHHHAVRQRAHCILLRSQGKRVGELLEIFLVSRKTLYNRFEAWESRSVAGLYDRAGRGRKPTFTPEQQEQIGKWSQEHRRQLKAVLDQMKAAWGIEVSHKTLTRLSLIEILWRFMQYEWIEISAYRKWQSLVDYVEKVLREFGNQYVINFV